MEDRPGSGLENPYEFRLSYDSHDPRQVWKASLIHALDVWNQVQLVDRFASSSATRVNGGGLPVPARSREKSSPRLQLILSDRQILTGYPLFVRLARSLRILWPLALFTWIPGFASLGKTLWPGCKKTGKTRDSSQ